jgi:hypothetical protein
MVRATKLKQAPPSTCACEAADAAKGRDRTSVTRIVRTRTTNPIIPSEFWWKIKSGTRRKSRDLPFDISKEYSADLFQEQGGRCALTGLELTFDVNSENGRTASLDRKDSALGYVEGNVQWVHKDINRMKLAYCQDYFIEMCARVAANRRPHGNDNQREALAGHWIQRVA